MKFNKSIFILFFVLTITLLPVTNGFTGTEQLLESDTAGYLLTSFFDLRDRESFVQVTNTSSDPAGTAVHVQIFNVDQDCNENNFFDFYTPNDTHVYNIRDILTNDGNPSGVVLPSNAYGMVVVTAVSGTPLVIDTSLDVLIGNFRVIDDTGYEYRTNSQERPPLFPEASEEGFTFNFNTLGNVTLSDIVGIVVNDTDDGSPEVIASDIINAYFAFEVDILNINEVIFSCRNVIFACVDQDNPRLEELFLDLIDQNEPSASVASFEYGINNAIPHSKDGELLCPGNIISEGIVRFSTLTSESDDEVILAGYVGLNNGNGRGSMDSIWSQSCAFGNNCLD